MAGYGKCPRCDCRSLEHLKSHSYCWECNYSPDTDLAEHLCCADARDDEQQSDELDQGLVDDEQDLESEEQL